MILAALAAFSLPAFGQERCGDRAAIVAELEGQYGETKQAQGLITQGPKSFIIEIFRNDETGTWTIFTSDPSGKDSCLVANGDFWVYDPDKGPAL